MTNRLLYMFIESWFYKKNEKKERWFRGLKDINLTQLTVGEFF